MRARRLLAVVGLADSVERFKRAGKRLRRRRGVVSVVAMMFVVMFGSLVAAMAISSQGNIRAASTHLHVSRSMNAAETGLTIAQKRVAEAASRFVVSSSTIDSAFVDSLWNGDLAGLGTITILPPPSGHYQAGNPAGLAEAIAQIHAADQNIIFWDGIEEATLGDAPSGVDLSVYADEGWVTTPIIALSTVDDPEEPSGASGFRITYAPLAGGTSIRMIVTGYDFGYMRQGQPLTRTIMQDVELAKRVEHAVISPSRIMIGKNVLVEGDLGARYTELDEEHGDPLVIRSDFLGLDPILDDKLEDLFDGLADYDVDGDNRLRTTHPTEGLGVPDNNFDYDNDGQPDGAFLDATNDGFVDEFDVFIRHYDTDGDGRVVLPSALTVGTPAEGQAAEFVNQAGTCPDSNLALMIDMIRPDRNRNGIGGFIDLDNDGLWDPDTEDLRDYDAVTETYPDQELGFRDGFIDKLDRYSKVQGSLSFVVSAASWTQGQGQFLDRVRGPIRPSAGDPPMRFEVDASKIPEFTNDSFTATTTSLRTACDGDAFNQQVADNLGIAVGSLATYNEVGAAGSGHPRYFRLDPDANHDGMPDNAATARFERMPYNSPNFNDWYYRPVYENMTFRDTQIPMGNNGLFINCTFIGVTWVRASASNDNPMWSIWGRMRMNAATGRPELENARYGWGDNAGEAFADLLPAMSAQLNPANQVVRLATNPLDRGDVRQSQVATFAAASLSTLPQPLVIGGIHVSDSKDFSNNLRFHDCLFVGSIVSDNPASFNNVRNKIQFTGRSRFASEHPEHPTDPAYNPDPEDLAVIARSSMMLPNFSVDIGTFNSPPEQAVALKGAVIAGLLDVRGNCDIDGALLLTYIPELGHGPLRDIHGNPLGNPSLFNTTLGYFGPDDGDEEAMDPETLPLVGGVKNAGWDTNNDGLADVSPFEAQPAGSTMVPFNGYGRIHLRFDPNIVLPDGLPLPMSIVPLAGSYQEGRL